MSRLLFAGEKSTAGRDIRNRNVNPPMIDRLEDRRLLAASYTLLPDIQFADVAGTALKLDLYLPARPAGPAPLVVFFHGGSWLGGDKVEGRMAANLLAPAGYAIASINYRFSTQAIWPAQIQDAKGAIRFLRANAARYNLNPDAFAAWGISAGAQIAAIVGTAGDVSWMNFGSRWVDVEGTVGGNAGVSSRVQAVVDWCGPTDFLRVHNYDPAADLPTSSKSRLLGGPVQQNPELALAASPQSYLTPDDPPVLIMHGTADTVVPFNQSELFYDALVKAGLRAQLHAVPGAGHGDGLYAGTESAARIQGRVVSFLNRELQAPRPCTVIVTARDARGSEVGANPATFIIRRTGDLHSAMTVRYTLAGTASSADYARLPGSVTIPAGAATAAVTIVPTSDLLREGDEDVRLIVSENPAYRVSQSSHQARAIIGDAVYRGKVPTVVIDAADTRASEAGLHPGQFIVTRSGDLSAPLTVRYNASGWATPGVDYVALPGTITIPAGQSSVSFSLTPIDDELMEPSELVTLTLVDSPAYALGKRRAAGVAILDNEPVVSINP